MKPWSDTPARFTAALRSWSGTLAHPLQRWWRERARREQRLMQVCAAVVTIALLWSWGLQPAIRSIQTAHQRLPQLRSEAARLDALLLEARQWQSRKTGSLPESEIPKALAGSLKRHGLEDSATPVSSITADSRPNTWEVRLQDAPAPALMRWLAAVPPQLHARIVTVELHRSQSNGRDRPGHVTGRVEIAFGGES